MNLCIEILVGRSEVVDRGRIGILAIHPNQGRGPLSHLVRLSDSLGHSGSRHRQSFVSADDWMGNCLEF